MTFSKKRLLRWGIPVLFIVCVFLTRTLWLRAAGEYLVDAQEPFPADIVVVLAGDDQGNRILKGAELVKQGYAPKVLVSGPACCYGIHESDLAIPFAVRHGFPAEWFIAYPMAGDSTRNEAREIMKELDRRGVKRFLVVTNNYHTRRAGRMYGELVDRSRFRVVAARDWAFRPEDWWQTRNGQKQFFFEWSKTIASWAGM